MTKHINFAMLALLPLASCGTEEHGQPETAAPFEATTEVRVERPVVVTAHFGGPYQGVYKHGYNCTMNGDWLDLTIADLDTNRPNVPIIDPPMPCDPIENFGGLNYIHCRQYAYVPAIPSYSHWNDFAIWFSPTTGKGHFFWRKEANQDHFCQFYFIIEETELFREWQ